MAKKFGASFFLYKMSYFLILIFIEYLAPGAQHYS